MLADALSAGRVAAVGPLRVRGLNRGTQFAAERGFTSMPSPLHRRWASVALRF
jgi:hypothetical protein